MKHAIFGAATGAQLGLRRDLLDCPVLWGLADSRKPRCIVCHHSLTKALAVRCTPQSMAQSHWADTYPCSTQACRYAHCLLIITMRPLKLQNTHRQKPAPPHSTSTHSADEWRGGQVCACKGGAGSAVGGGGGPGGCVSEDGAGHGGCRHAGAPHAPPLPAPGGLELPPACELPPPTLLPCQ